MTRGIFVALEGIDGSGTTTQAARLKTRLEDLGLKTHATAEPSEGPIGITIRRVLQGELGMDDDALALAFAADRLDHWNREIEPALAKGRVVISDRFVLSSLAYQSLSSPLEWIVTLNGRAPRADLNVFLRINSHLAGQRVALRDGDSERFETDDFQRRVAVRYDEVCRRRDVGPVVSVNSEASIEQTEAAIWEHVQALLSARGVVA
ncbi:MAG: dTMP kinase [Myxococcota bacterium]